MKNIFKWIGAVVIVFIIIVILIKLTNSAPTSNTFDNEQSCASLLSDFETRTSNELDNVSSMTQEGWSTSEENYIVGYSKSLNTCIGGYKTTSEKDFCKVDGYNSNPCDSVVGSFNVVNLTTNQLLQTFSFSNGPGGTSINAALQQYGNKFSQLTEGQVQIDQ